MNNIFYSEEAIEFIQNNTIAHEKNYQEITLYKDNINNNIYEKIIITLFNEGDIIILNYDAYKDKKKVTTTFQKFKFELTILKE